MLQALKNETNVAYTANGARVYKTTTSALVDFFGSAGATRNQSEQDIIRSFGRALAEDELIAMKLLFYFRDVTEGQGERRLFRVIIHDLAKSSPKLIKKNLHLIPTFGRWDDLYALVGTPLEKDAFDLIKKQIIADLKEVK